MLEPAFKDYIWGGEKLRTDFNKKCDFDRVAESWELSCHKDGNSVILNGEFKGKTLEEYIKFSGKAVLGKNCDRFEYFPVLIKLIDAKDNLSVQVHPDNDYALKNEGEYGKTEMWYIVDCDEGSSLIYGLNKEISKEEFSERIKSNTLLEVTNSVPVKKGDVFFIESGTLHAIGKGIVIAEIQQNSNTTYRVYDYGRIGADGKPRPLHVEKAIDVTSLKPLPERAPISYENFDGYKKACLSSCEYFNVYKYNISKSVVFNADEKSFNSVLVIDGSGSLNYENKNIEINKGDSIFIPAGMGKYIINGNLSVILTDI
ncbi:MAG TPA: class I mannose-6-phosphate isomerase [Oscillospiraceae bacterium]|nr:class I mannose-6-phosphate isomerase [Oscillospiraceae bacterium]